MNKKRIEKVAQLLQENKLPQLLVSSPYSIFYLTGKWIFPGERMVTLLVNDQGEATLYAARLFALPGTVEAWDPETQTADIRPAAPGRHPGSSPPKPLPKMKRSETGWGSVCPTSPSKPWRAGALRSRTTAVRWWC